MSTYGSTLTEESPLRQRLNNNNEVPLEEFTEQPPTANQTGEDQLDDTFIDYVQMIPITYESEEITVHWRKLIRELFAEWLGVTLFVYLGTGSVIASAPFEGRLSSSSVVVIALGFGFGITTMIYATAHISGGHLNPAVTLGIVMARKMTVFKGALYVIVQCIGGICGSIMIYLTLPTELSEYTSYGATTLTKNGSFCPIPFLAHCPGQEIKWDIHTGGGILLETSLTFFLVFCVFATASLPGDQKKMGAFAPQSIGLVVVCGHLFGIPFTGPSMNPARSFGPAVISGTWKDHWVYWVGPLLGGALASVIYTQILAGSIEKSKQKLLKRGGGVGTLLHAPK